MLGAACGIAVRAEDSSIILEKPILPAAIQSVSLAGLSVGDSHASLCFTRAGDDVTVSVHDRSGPAGVIIRK
jgi:hypothetical protein